MAGGRVGIAAATAAAIVASALGGCGDDDGDAEPDRTQPDRANRGLLFRVPTEHMEPTLQFRQVVELDPDFDRIEVGDIVVFNPPSNAQVGECATTPKPGQACPRSASTTDPVSFIKRVVAVGGDRVSIEQGRVYADGEVERERYPTGPGRCRLCDLPTPVTIPRGQLYVLGDRRGDNSDSRDWGPIRTKWVTGKVVGVP
jgi:signal peptidase I